MKKYKPYIISVLIALGVGGLSALLTKDYMNVYEQINKPPLAPPPVVFPIVWTVLYILMGIGSAKVWLKSENPLERNSTIRIYGIQLIVNFFWSIIFFRLRMFTFAFLWLLLLVVLVVLMILEFRKIDKISGNIQIPYLLWLLFAAFLNLMTVILN